MSFCGQIEGYYIILFYFGHLTRSYIFLIFTVNLLIRNIFSHKSFIVHRGYTQSWVKRRLMPHEPGSCFVSLKWPEIWLTWKFEWVLKGDGVTEVISQETSSGFTQDLLATGLWLGMFTFMRKAASSSCGTVWLFYNY